MCETAKTADAELHRMIKVDPDAKRRRDFQLLLHRTSPTPFLAYKSEQRTFRATNPKRKGFIHTATSSTPVYRANGMSKSSGANHQRSQAEG